MQEEEVINWKLQAKKKLEKKNYGKKLDRAVRIPNSDIAGQMQRPLVQSKAALKSTQSWVCPSFFHESLSGFGE